MKHKPEPNTPAACMADAMDTFVERGKVYGEAYKQFGPIMMALFPNGIVLKSADDWNRYSCLHMEVAKLARYCQNFSTGHIDSQHDLCVYAAMLESLDREAEAERSDNGVPV